MHNTSPSLTAATWRFEPGRQDSANLRARASPTSPAPPPMGKLATFIDRAMSRFALVLVLAVFCIVLVDTWRQFVTGYPGYVKFRNPPEKFK